jgi:hypothetical protein
MLQVVLGSGDAHGTHVAGEALLLLLLLLLLLWLLRLLRLLRLRLLHQ